MKKFIGAGGSSAFAVALFLGLGDSSAALAQEVQARLPVVQAVVSNPLLQPSLPTNIFTQPAVAAPQAVPLSTLVASQDAEPLVDAESKCLATAVYFESMGEPLEGQLAVAQVVINRAQSGRYPASWCGVVKQKAQFSFVRAGRFPRINPDCQAWRKAQAIARIAADKLAYTLPTDVLWYHADYVAPGWGKRLTRVEKIGAHIFYRA